MDSGFGCRRSGAVPSSAVVARRAASASPSSCRPSTPAPEHASYPRRHRLTRGSDLHKVLREGKRARTAHLAVRFLASLLHHLRVGIIVPKHGRSSVERNRLKRRLREILRREIVPVISERSMDVVVRTNSRAYEMGFEALRLELREAMQRLLAVSRDL